MPTEQIDKHLKANMTMRKREIMLANFLGGLAWGFGTVIGATIVISIIVGALQTFNFLPYSDQLIKQFEQPKMQRIQTE